MGPFSWRDAFLPLEEKTGGPRQRQDPAANPVRQCGDSDSIFNNNNLKYKLH